MRKGHYAWAVCAGSAMLLFCTSGLCVNAFTIYQPYILSQNGFSNAQSSLIITVRSLLGFAATMLSGVYYRKFSLRAGMGLAGGCVAAAFFVFSAAGANYAVYLLAAALAGIGYGFGTMVPVSMLMQRWFIEKRAEAVGLCSAVTGLATLGFPSLITAAIERWGMAAAFRAEGAVIVVMVTACVLLIRSRPADKGLRPYGSWDAIDHAVRERTGGRLKKADWALLAPAMLCIGAFTSAGYSHLTVLAQGQGYASGPIALAITASGITLMAAKYGYGLVEERLGARISNRLFGACLLAGLGLCCFGLRGGTAMLLAAVVIYSAGLPLGTVGLSVWAGDLAAPEDYDAVIRRFQTLYAAGSLIFSAVPGILADHFGGSYVPAYLVFFACAAFALAAVGWVYARRAPSARMKR